MQEIEYSEQNRIFSQVNVKDFLIRNDWKVLCVMDFNLLLPESRFK